MHGRDARAAGEIEQRRCLLDAWPEAPFIQVPEEACDRVKQRFDAREPLDPTLAAVAINGWHRLAVSSRGACPERRPPSLEPTSTRLAESSTKKADLHRASSMAHSVGRR